MPAIAHDNEGVMQAIAIVVLVLLGLGRPAVMPPEGAGAFVTWR
jgi:hypothetical protein